MKLVGKLELVDSQSHVTPDISFINAHSRAAIDYRDPGLDLHSGMSSVQPLETIRAQPSVDPSLCYGTYPEY
jgi:hypothetical protein